MTRSRPVVVFDLDGTLLDSDEALVAAFVACGVPRHEVTFGHVVDDECRRLGIDPQAYRAAYDEAASSPFPGVDEMLRTLGEWFLCSNKLAGPARRELARLGWVPQRAWFAEDFDGPKHLQVVIDACHVRGEDIVYVGDTEHDRGAAGAIGAQFVLAGWNPRSRPADGDLVAAAPDEVPELVERLSRPRRTR